jgi:integrase
VRCSASEGVASSSWSPRARAVAGVSTWRLGPWRLQAHGARQDDERAFMSREWTYAFGKVLRSAGLAKVRIHDLRHTAATLLLQGMHPKVVHEFLGHSSVTLTLDTYSHVPSLHVEVAARMQGLVEAPEPNGSKLAAKPPELASEDQAEGAPDGSI